MDYFDKVIDAFGQVYDFLSEQEEASFLLISKQTTLQALRLHKELAEDAKRAADNKEEYVLTDGFTISERRDMTEDSYIVQARLAEELTGGTWTWRKVIA